MKQSELQKIVNEEIQAVLEISMTKRFTKAVEELQKIQLAQQKLRKQFVAEKDPTKKEKLKQAIIKMHKVVQKVEQNFNDAIKGEPIVDVREGKLNERSKTAKQYGLSDDFDDAVADLKDKEFTTKGITKLAKKHKQNPKKAILYVKDAFEWLWKEGKLTEASKPKSTTAKDILDFMLANMKNISSSKIPPAYKKEYIKSMTNMARRKPMDFAKDYGKFKKSDWIEDITYNLQNEGKSEVISQT
jgi:transcriptional regulator of heat shock response